MKKIPCLITIALLSLSNISWSQTESDADSTGLPGDNFSLEAALELFSKAASLEDFEKALNEADNSANNLDLNQDGDIDYLRVEDRMEEDAHAVVIQSWVNEQEVQDIAVIEIEKNGNESAVLQIVGDEELYGDEKIVEPADEKVSGGKGGPSVGEHFSVIIVNVWLWPSVRFIYGPAYRPWISPYRWAYYPLWWKPWRVHPYHWHWNRCHIYHPRYTVVYVHRVNRAHSFYRTKRVTSVHVHNHYAVVRTNHKSKAAGTKGIGVKSSGNHQQGGKTHKGNNHSKNSGVKGGKENGKQNLHQANPQVKSQPKSGAKGKPAKGRK